MTLGANSRLWLIVSPKLYETLSLVQGGGGYILQNGAIGAIKVAVSDAATTVATLIDSKKSRKSWTASRSTEHAKHRCS